MRLGVHTGLVVVGEVGGGTRQEQLALGETPNLAARLQGIAVPNTLVISAPTFQLLGGFFACQPLGTPLLKGLAQPLAVYRVLYESMARSRLEAAVSTGWTPLVGREQESGLLLERWAQVKEGLGQVVLLSGEAGIGKSRLVQVLKNHVATEPQTWLTPCQCSPYYQHTALYPMIDLLERVALRFAREESPPQKLSKLEGFVVQYGLPLAEAVPLFAALLSLPLPADYAPLTMSPEQQKQQTLHALVTILVRIATQPPVLFVMEDLHWVDPTTLELLTLLVDQGPTTRILALWTCRPDFTPPWTGRSHLTQVTLHRLTRPQATEIIRRVAHGKTLPSEVVAQIVAKTDGVPLFVEELTKMVLESDQATYRFKHALIQEAAYQALLRSTRQQHHEQIAQRLEEQFPETVETQPELLAHHYTEAVLLPQAIPYWQRAGCRALQRSANQEARQHLTHGLELLNTLPDTSERQQHELEFQIALGSALSAIKGWAAPEVEQAYNRARELCQQVGETPQLPQVLWGLWFFYHVRGEFRIALEQAESLLILAQHQQDSALRLLAHTALGADSFHLGALVGPKPT